MFVFYFFKSSHTPNRSRSSSSLCVLRSLGSRRCQDTLQPGRADKLSVRVYTTRTTFTYHIPNIFRIRIIHVTIYNIHIGIQVGVQPRLDSRASTRSTRVHVLWLRAISSVGARVFSYILYSRVLGIHYILYNILCTISYHFFFLFFFLFRRYSDTPVHFFKDVF